MTQRQTVRNRAVRSKFRTAIKRFEKALEAEDMAKAEELLQVAITEIDRAASKGVIHRNQAARRKSRLTKRLNKAS